ncbi:MAG: flavin reductase family protein [Planctomycetaceae bacterium]
MEIDIASTRASIVYQHLTRIIAPRPIAWVSTRSKDGLSNIAPFSFFAGVGSRPATLLFCPANRLDGSPKDTLRNIRETGEFVVNVVTEELAVLMNESAADLPESESEFAACDIPETASKTVKAPTVAISPASIECSLLQEHAIGSGPGGANIVVGSIQHISIADHVLDESGFADVRKLHLIGRMGGNFYSRTSDIYELERPRQA